MTTTADELREKVRRRYADAALAVDTSAGCGCGEGGCCSSEGLEPGLGEALYAAEERDALPEAAVLASLGCGNPTAVADLREGEIVLDLDGVRAVRDEIDRRVRGLNDSLAPAAERS